MHSTYSKRNPQRDPRVEVVQSRSVRYGRVYSNLFNIFLSLLSISLAFPFLTLSSV
jgi:hypothetical protein